MRRDKRATELPSCPACGHRHLHRSSPKTTAEALLRLTPLRLYRCHACQHRGWTLRVVSQGELAELDEGQRQRRRRRVTAAIGWPLAVLAALAATVGLALASCARRRGHLCEHGGRSQARY